MRFGPVAIAEAAGAILAHAAVLPSGRLAKGRVLTEADIAALLAAGAAEIVVARLDPGDVPEDAAAARAARPLLSPGIEAGPAYTGRVNLHAGQAGLLLVDRIGVDRLNAIHEGLTLATLVEHAVVASGQMVATVKVIPFALPEAALALWEQAAAPLRLAPFRPHRAGLVQTLLPGTKPSLPDKMARLTQRRLEALGSRLVAERRVPHDAASVAASVRALVEAEVSPILIASASAIIDRRDVVPEGIVAAGGEIQRFGMPVDPGNLLLLARIGATPVLGLPGCARSPKLNGFDWVLERVLAGLPLGTAEIGRMGVGGLLGEIPSRGLPREAGEPAAGVPRIAALVLAAGRASRMGENKLLIEAEGKSLVERAVDAALGSRAADVLVVLGHEAAAVRRRLGDRSVEFVENPDYAEGLSTSLRAGVAALGADCDGILVCLADMPDVGPGLLDRMIAAYAPVEGREIVVPTRAGRRGNPVLWGRRFLPALLETSGDTGARHLIGENAEFVAEIPCEDDSVLTDLDTQEALAAWRAARRRAVGR
jgi:molybdenum cofactor cytidylyltransferase